jgi:hypothetical protein
MNVVTPPQTLRGKILAKSLRNKPEIRLNRVVRACTGFSPQQREPPCSNEFRELPALHLI